MNIFEMQENYGFLNIICKFAKNANLQKYIIQL